MVRSKGKCAILATLIVCLLTYGAQATTLEVWTPPNQAGAMEAAIQAYHQKYPEMQVVHRSAGRDDMVTSLLGGVAPDVITLQGDWTIQFADAGLLQSLDDRTLERARIASDDFWPGVIPHTRHQGVRYALPYTAAPHFALMWNMQMFEEAGVDSSRAPGTLEDLFDVHRRLTRASADGAALERVGFLPWKAGPLANSLQFYGGFFGGELYDAEAARWQVDSRANQDAVLWLSSFIVDPLVGLPPFSGQGSGAQFFSNVQVAMTVAVPGWVRQVDQQAPDVRFGVGTVPSFRSGGARGDFMAGWTVGVPAGGEFNEHAWHFIRFLLTEDEGTTAFSLAASEIPSYRYAPVIGDWTTDPLLRPFIEIAGMATRSRPLAPAPGNWQAIVNDAVQAALFDDAVTPVHALQQANERLQAELNHFLNQ